MADITRFPLARHLRGAPTQHVRHLRQGKLVHDGTGLSFFFRPLTAVLSEVPVDDRELPLLFHARTADFQDLTVAGQRHVPGHRPGHGLRADRLLDRPGLRALARHAAGAGRRAADRDRAAAGAGPDRAQLAGQRAGRRAEPGPGPDPARPDRRPAAGRDRHRRHRRAGGRDPARAGDGEGAAHPGPRAGPAGGRPGHLRAARAGRASASGPSPRTRCRARSSWPGARSSWSRSAAPTPAARPRTPPRPARSRPRRRPSRELRLAQAGAEGTRALGAAEAETEAAKLAAVLGAAAGHAAGAGGQGAGRAAAADRQPGAQPGPARPGAGRPDPRRAGPGRGRRDGHGRRSGEPVMTLAAAGRARAPPHRAAPSWSSGTALTARPPSSWPAAAGGWPRSRPGTSSSRPPSATVAAAIPAAWRRGVVERADLPRFLFEPEDIIVVVGQDGLVANVAKYLDGQCVIGINAEPARNPGVLVPHPPEAAGALLAAAGRPGRAVGPAHHGQRGHRRRAGTDRAQ